MTRLLSEQELRNQLAYYVDEDVQQTLIDLIHSQKLAHADMVIGEDEEYDGNAYGIPAKTDAGAVVRNSLRFVQRERNK